MIYDWFNYQINDNNKIISKKIEILFSKEKTSIISNTTKFKTKTNSIKQSIN